MSGCRALVGIPPPAPQAAHLLLLHADRCGRKRAGMPSGISRVGCQSIREGSACDLIDPHLTIITLGTRVSAQDSQRDIIIQPIAPSQVTGHSS